MDAQSKGAAVINIPQKLLKIKYDKRNSYKNLVTVFAASTAFIILTFSSIIFLQQQQISQHAEDLENLELRLRTLELRNLNFYHKEYKAEELPVKISNEVRLRKKRGIRVKSHGLNARVVPSGDYEEDDDSGYSRHDPQPGSGSEPDYTEVYWETTSAPVDWADEHGNTYRNSSKHIHMERHRSFSGDSEGLRGLLGQIGMGQGSGQSQSSSSSSSTRGFIAFGGGAGAPCLEPKPKIPCKAAGVDNSGEYTSKELNIGGRSQGRAGGAPDWATMLQLPSGTYRSSFDGGSSATHVGSGSGVMVGTTEASSSGYDYTRRESYSRSSSSSSGSVAGGYRQQHGQRTGQSDNELEGNYNQVYQGRESGGSSYNSGYDRAYEYPSTTPTTITTTTPTTTQRPYAYEYDQRVRSGHVDRTSYSSSSRDYDRTYDYYPQPQPETTTTTTTTPTPIYDNSYYQSHGGQRNTYSGSQIGSGYSGHSYTGYSRPSVSKTYEDDRARDQTNYVRTQTRTETVRSGSVSSNSMCSGPRPLAAHYVGTGDVRYSGGWVSSSWMQTSYQDNFVLSANGIVAVRKGGVYFIYAQVHFETDYSSQGLTIQVNGQDTFHCDAERKRSCFTGGLQFLNANDQITIVNESRSVMAAEKSYFGLVNIVGSSTGDQLCT